MGVKYLCKVYGVRSSDIRSLGIEYSKGVIGIKVLNILDSIIIDIDKKWGVFKRISKKL